MLNVGVFRVGEITFNTVSESKVSLSNLRVVHRSRVLFVSSFCVGGSSLSGNSIINFI